MNSPKPMTENNERANEVLEEHFREILNFNKNQSSEESFEKFAFTEEIKFEQNFEKFIGDSEESTEISIILSNLNSSQSSNSGSESQRAESLNESGNKEILTILKRNSSVQKVIPCRAFSHGVNSLNNKNNLNSIKKISLAGRVLKSADNTTSENLSPVSVRRNEILITKRPERLSNPILKDAHFNNYNNNNFHFFGDLQ